jgi:hypothetical protein
MWHTRNKLCTISISPHAISFSLFGNTNATQPTLLAHQIVPLPNLELVHLRICNLTRLKEIITTFAHTHNLGNIPVLLSLQGNELIEQRVVVAESNPEAHQFALALKRHHMWDRCYLHPTQDGNFAFYACALPQALLFQYKLLAINAGINLTHITTQRLALLHAYKQMQDSAFRPAQLGVHLTEKNNDLERIVDPEIVWRMIKTTPSAHLPEQIDPKLLLIHCGLEIIGKMP